MKLDICIVEDEKIDAKVLKVILEDYLIKRHFEYTIKIYDTGRAFFADFEKGYISPTTIFMDIFLPHSNGLEICKKMRSMGYVGDILITAETKEHALEAIKVDARAYILKPYKAPEVFEVLEKVCRYALFRTYTLKIRNRFVKIPLAEIMYVESNGPSCTFYCMNNIIYTIRKKLDVIEEEMNDIHFLRCHKSYLVNMDLISAAEGNNFTLTTGDTIPIKTTDTKSVLDAYNNFMENIQ